MRGPEAGSAAAGVVHAVEDGTLRGSQPSRGDTRGTNAGVHYVAPDHRIREFSTPLRMAGVPVSPSFEAERAGPSGRLRSPRSGAHVRTRAVEQLARRAVATEQSEGSTRPGPRE